ncbi:MAG: bifunctional 3-(3-hydroxy-phenyl)propionate/3-hydroxycinnamic acid hydroxylase [Pseudomonadota bacterium]
MPKPAFDTQVLIVGAGPTGLLLANLLGRMGVQATIVERNPSTVQEPRAVSIDDESMRALQAAGLDTEIAAITAKGYGSIYYGPNGRPFAEVKPRLREYGFDKRNAFEQPEFEARLRKALSNHATLDARFETSVTGFEQDGDGVTVALHAGGQTDQIRARYMVACDGGRSATRKTLGISMEGTTFEEPWLIVDLKTTRNRCFHTEVFCDPERSAISLPGPGGIRRYEFKLNPGETAEEAENDAFARRLLAQVGDDQDEPIRRRQVYTFHARIAERWRAGRVFLAGDAAHLTPPFAGQGMNSGLRDAHNLAWKLDEALRMDRPDALLDSYQTERKPHAWSMIELALRMGRVMMPRSALKGALTRAGFKALSLYPPARDYVALMKYKPKPRFEDGMIETLARGQPNGAVGRMIPQPIVTTPERRDVLLDTILPDQPVLLVYAEQPETRIGDDVVSALAAKGVATIGLTPEWINPLKAHVPIVRDKMQLFAQEPFRACLGYGLLLRRDRYVAAVTNADDSDALSGMIERIRAPRSCAS